MLKSILVVTPPRTGTHFLVTSISKSLNIPEIMLEDYNTNNSSIEESIKNIGSNIDTSKRFVVGMHARKTNNLLNLSEKFNIITTKRHPIGQAVSILGFYRVRKRSNWCKELGGSEQVLYNGVPNSHNFVQYVQSKRFYDLRKITEDWDCGNNVIDIDKIMHKNINELNKLNELVGDHVDLFPFDYSSKKYPDTAFHGDPDYWKTVVSKNTLNSLKEEFGSFDLDTYCENDLSGNQKFINDFNNIEKKVHITFCKDCDHNL